jgi:thiol-disulfide isomerase/thioredoxin
MKLKLSLLYFVLLFSVHLSAQELTVELSQHANKQVFIVAVHGVRKDTIGTIVLDKAGRGILNYKTQQPFAGLVNLTIKDKEHLSFDFVLSLYENPLLRCDGEYVYTQNTRIENSPENNCLNRWFDAVVQYKQKISLNQELSKLYLAQTPFIKVLETEKKYNEEQLQKLTDTLNHSPLFAAKYMRYKMAQEEKLSKVWESNEERTIAKNFFANQIDFEALYGSSMWFPIINSCIEAYIKDSPFYQTFGTDVVSNLKRIKSQQVYEDLIEAAFSVTEKFAWDKDQDVIVDYVMKESKIKKPTLKLQKIIEAHNLSTGKKAPNLQISHPFVADSKTTVLKTSELKSKYSLLLFYLSDCGHCKTTIEGLKQNYQNLVKNGIKIISIAGDVDQETFKNTASQLPWTDTYCDLMGMNGVNFKNYAVMGTPTMYVLDSKGIILSKMATINDVLDFVKKQ